MYIPVAPRNSENDAANDLHRTEVQKITFTHAEILGFTFGGLGMVRDF